LTRGTSQTVWLPFITKGFNDVRHQFAHKPEIWATSRVQNVRSHINLKADTWITTADTLSCLGRSWMELEPDPDITDRQCETVDISW